MYTRHPSDALNALFEAQPYQGAVPESATFLFVGLDANYDAAIEQSPAFATILEYHADGVSFWRKYGVHHPFLLPGYAADGRLYHRSFAKIGFTPAQADQVSFVELLHVPTVGRSVLVPEDLDRAHLAVISRSILQGEAQHVFLPSAVARLMRASKMFPWLTRTPVANCGALDVLYQEGSKTVYSHLHFSVYGKFEQRKREQAREIGRLRSYQG